MKFKTHKVIYLVLTILLVILAGLTGYYISSRVYTVVSQAPLVTSNKPPLQKLIYQHQTATIEGMVTSLNNNQATVVSSNSQANLTDVFPLAKGFSINHTNPATGQSIISKDAKSIELNKTATVILEIIDGNYQIVSILYVSQEPSSQDSPIPAHT